MSYAFQIVFKTEAQAKECATWFDGAGEQDWWGWAEFQEHMSEDDENFDATNVVEIK